MKEEAKRATAATSGSVVSSGKIGAELKCEAHPSFIAERIKLFDQIYAKNVELYKSISPLPTFPSATSQAHQGQAPRRLP